jgi:hypothetical protein
MEVGWRGSQTRREGVDALKKAVLHFIFLFSNDLNHCLGDASILGLRFAPKKGWYEPRGRYNTHTYILMARF